MSEPREYEIEEWYNQYHQTIFKFILMMTKDYQQSEDLTHETFLNAYRYYYSYKRDASPKTWLFKIAHNVTVDYIRKQKPIQFFKEIFHLNRESNLHPESIVQMKENSRELFNAVGNLKESYRTVIILRKIKGFSISETSTILNWSESKVKSTLFRAINTLEKNLAKEEYSNGQPKREKLL